MAIFTYIATTIVTAIGLTGLTATIVTSVIATGLAMVTSRILNPGPKGGQPGSGAGQGVRIQLPPATTNKVPVIYGRAHTNPIITDAYISNENKTMTYVMAISETINVSTAEYILNDIYWNDDRLEYGEGDDANKVLRGKKWLTNDRTQEEDDINEDYDGNVWVGVWRWNAATQSAERVKRPDGSYFGSLTPAQFFPEGQVPAEYQMEGFVWALLRENYNPEKGFTGLPTLTFDIVVSDNGIPADCKRYGMNPAIALIDYMTSYRYGAGLEASNLDIPSMLAWKDYCDETAPWTPIDGGPTEYDKRYSLSGIINTNGDVKSNIDSMLISTGAWISYDTHQGKWRIIPKRAQASTMLFTDDNIVSGLTLSSTRLEELYNIVEAQYYDRENKDQILYATINLFDANPALLNYNEPEIPYSLTLEFCNNNIQAERIANMELEQMRDDLVITFTASHWGLQCQAGDVIKVNNTIYGWVSPEFPGGKEFRVMRVREVESEDGLIGAEITALEYNAQVYDDKTITEFYPRENIGIPRTGSSNELTPPSVTITDIDNTNSSPSFNIQITIPDDAGIINEIEIWYSEGDDYAGLGGDSTFLGQIGLLGEANNTLYVTGLPASNIGKQLYLNVPEAGYSSELTNTTAAGARITSFLTGNGGNGEYQVETDYNVPISRMRATLARAKMRGYIANGNLTVTEVTFGDGNIQRDCLFTGIGVADGTIISGQISGTSGSVGVYSLSIDGNNAQHPDLGSVSEPVDFIMRNPFPHLEDYQLLTIVKPAAGETSFTRGEQRSIAITGLPANGENKKYFLKSKSVSTGVFGRREGPFSELGTVDLEVPSVFWNPNNANLSNQLTDVKNAILKLDFGYMVIPNNGLWLWKTMTQIDFGKMVGATPGPSPYQMDLGSTDYNPENTVDVDVVMEDFVWQGDTNYFGNYIPPTTNPTPPSVPVDPVEPPPATLVFIDPRGTFSAQLKNEGDTASYYNTNQFRSKSVIHYWSTTPSESYGQFAWGQYVDTAGYNSIGISAIEGHIRLGIRVDTNVQYPIGTPGTNASGYLVGGSLWPWPEEFERYNYETGQWQPLINPDGLGANYVPLFFTKYPPTYTAGVSGNFIKLRYVPTRIPISNSVSIVLSPLDPTGITWRSTSGANDNLRWYKP